jgi:hypothetical protein
LNIFGFVVARQPFSDPMFSVVAGTIHSKDELHSKKKETDSNGKAARYWLLVAVLTVQFVPHRKHTPSP